MDKLPVKAHDISAHQDIMMASNNKFERKVSLITEPPSTSEMIDKLRTIKPFNEKQLLTFYQNELLENNKEFIENFVQTYKIKDLNSYYETLVKLERCNERFELIEKVISDLHNSIKDVEMSCWVISPKTLTKWESCGDDRKVEETITYQFAEFKSDSVNELYERYYKILRERILNEQMVSHYYQRYGQLQFELDLFRKLQWIKSQPSQLLLLSNRFLKESDDENDDENDYGNEQLKDSIFEAHTRDFYSLITALFIYFRKQDILVKGVHSQFKQCLFLLCYKYLTIANLEDRLFILNHILRCQSGSSIILSELIDCPDPLPHRSSNYQYGKRLVDFSVAVIATILSPIDESFLEKKTTGYKDLEKSNVTSLTESKKSDHWLLVDNEFDDEEISLTSIEIAEIDLISYLKRVPFENCLKFIGLSDDIHEISSIETGMMKLFAFNTRLIQILRTGLENFNCLRFKELTLFLSSLIKQIIRHSSINWIWCKEKCTTSDQALLLRLQVEFDNFMLRSITALLSTNRRGVWPLLAQVEFVGITEQMLWHILWVVYNNGLDRASDNISGLCPYMSANYWKDMFARHYQWKFVFLEKISKFSIEEASSFMDFLFNMAMSRHENDDSDFLEEIIRRIAEICLLKRCTLSTKKLSVDNDFQTIKNQELFILKGTVCLISLLDHFKTLISFLMQFIDEQSDNNELVEIPLIELFQALNLCDFVPNELFYKFANKWIIEKKCENILNRLGRIVLTKVQWNQIAFHSQSTTCLLIEEKYQRLQAYNLYIASQRAIEENMLEFRKYFKNKEKITIIEIFKRFCSKICTYDGSLISLQQLANSTLYEDFFGWICRSLMLLRIHPLSFVPDEASLDEIIFYKQDKSNIRNLEQNNVNFKHRIFMNLPRPTDSLECEFGLLFHELTLDCDKQNPIAFYIIASMSEWIVKQGNTNILEIIYNMFKEKSYMLLNFLNYFTLMNFNDKIIHDQTMIFMIIEILQSGLQKELSSIILNQLRRFRTLENAFTVTLFWTEILLSVMQFALQNFNKTSWLSTINPTSYLIKSTGSIHQSIEYLLCDIAKIMDQLCEAIIFYDYKLFDLFVNHYSSHRKGFFGAFKDMKLVSILEHPPNRNNFENFQKQNKNQWNIFGMLSWSSKEEICREVFVLTDKNCLSSEYLNPFQVLLRQAINRKLVEKSTFNFGLKKYQETLLTSLDMPLYFIYVSHEIHLRRFRDIWSLLVYELHLKQDSDDALEKAINISCKAADISIVPVQLLPINSLIVFLLNSFPVIEQIDVFATKSIHPLLPLLWRNFFQLYFSYPEGSSSVGFKLINEQIRNQLTLRLNLLYDQHNERWKQFNYAKNSDNIQISKSFILTMMTFEERLFKFYKSSKLWLNDTKLHNSYVNFDDNPEYICIDFQRELFKSIFTNDNSGTILRMFFLNYINNRHLKSVENDETLWNRTIRDIISLDNDNIQKIKPFIEETKDDLKEIYDFKSLKIINRNKEEEISIESVEQKIGQYGSIINYYSDLSSLINVDLLNEDNYINLNSKLPEFNSFLMIIHQLIDCIVEEARLVENQLNNYSKLCYNNSKEILPNLFKETRKIIKKSIPCDRSTNNFDCCSSWAKFTFDYNEWIENDFQKQQQYRFIQEYDSIFKILTKELPVQKVVASIYFLNRITIFIQRYFHDNNNIDNKNNQEKLLKQLFQSMIGWIHLLNSVYSIKYIIIVQVLDLFLELLSSLTDKYSDHVNYFILEIALQKNINLSLIQQLAPFLNPAKFQNSKTFINMYRLIGDNLYEASSQQTIFVLLSKFDLIGWLKNINDESLLCEFIQTHLNCLKKFGQSPNEEFMVTFDLYQKHLQDLLLAKFPNYLSIIIENIFDGMISFKIAPKLWNTILHTFGFYTKSLSFTASSGSSSSLINFDFNIFENDLSSYVYHQTIFNSHDLYNVCELLIKMHLLLEQNSQTEILDHFKIYVGKYIQFLGFISFCWIQTNSSKAPDDILILWLPLFEMWRKWIFVRQSTKFVALEHLSFAWQMWIEVFKYCSSLLGRFQNKLLSLFWQEFLNHVLNLEKYQLHSNDIEMFQDKLLTLQNWNKFEPSLKDIELMYEAIIQDCHSLTRLISFVISKINWSTTISKQRLTYEQLAQIIDNLSCVLICLSNEPNIRKLDLNYIPFGILNPENVRQLCFMLFPTIKSKMNNLTISKESLPFFKNFEIQDSFDLSLLYYICNLNISQNNFFQDSCEIPKNYFQDCWITSKMVYYTNCISLIITHFCNTNQEILCLKQNNFNGLEHIRNLLKIWSQNIKTIFITMNGDDQILLFNTLLNFLSQIQSEELQIKVTKIFTSVISYAFVKSDIIGSLIIAINRTITSKTILIYLLEVFVELFLDLNGELIFLIKNIHFNGNHLTDELLVEIKNQKAFLIFLIFIYSRLCNSTVPKKCILDYVYALFNNETQLNKLNKENNIDSKDEAKLLLFLTKIISFLTRTSNSDLILPKLCGDSTINLSFVSIDSGQYVKNCKDFHSEYNLKSLEALLKVCKNMDEFITESLSRSWFFFKSLSKFSNWCLFSIQILILHGACTALEVFYPNDTLVEYESLFINKNIQQQLQQTIAERKMMLLPELEDNDRFKSEIFSIIRSSHNRLFDNWRKDKAFVDVWHTIDAILIMFNGRLQRIMKNFRTEIDTNSRNVPFMIAEQLRIFQTERYTLIHNNLLNKLNDTNFIKSYL